MSTLVAVVLGALGVALIIAGARGAAPSVLGTLIATTPKPQPTPAATRRQPPRLPGKSNLRVQAGTRPVLA